jgi:hypothetical protein
MAAASTSAAARPTQTFCAALILRRLRSFLVAASAISTANRPLGQPPQLAGPSGHIAAINFAI